MTYPINDKLPDHRLDGAAEVSLRTTASSATPAQTKGDDLEALALDLTKRIEREFYYDQPGGSGQTRAKVQVIIADAIASRIQSLTADLATSKTSHAAARENFCTMQGSAAALAKQVQSLTASNEALERKLAGIDTCGCSYDAPGDVCQHHSPALQAAQAEIAKMREALRKIASMHLATTGGTHRRARYNLNRARLIARTALTPQEPT